MNKHRRTFRRDGIRWPSIRGRISSTKTAKLRDKQMPWNQQKYEYDKESQVRSANSETLQPCRGQKSRPFRNLTQHFVGLGALYGDSMSRLHSPVELKSHATYSRINPKRIR
jgi:hypothetical protein